MNKYELNARIYPTIITLFPFIILGTYFSVQYDSFYQAIGGIGLTAVFTFLFGQIGRDRGKKAEKKLWKEWGGTPSTQILRYSDDTFDAHTKTNIHLKLHSLTNTGDANMHIEESNNPENADSVYLSWCNYLRSQTRDTTKFKLLFSENINYGFRRNLWGLKLPALLLATVVLLTIILNEYFNFIDFQSISTNSWISVAALILIILFWIFYVNKKWIHMTAFAYAERLVESTNLL
jgi:hypothetical protein